MCWQLAVRPVFRSASCKLPGPGPAQEHVFFSTFHKQVQKHMTNMKNKIRNLLTTRRPASPSVGFLQVARPGPSPRTCFSKTTSKTNDKHEKRNSKFGGNLPSDQSFGRLFASCQARAQSKNMFFENNFKNK